MKWEKQVRRFWDVGEETIFLLSKPKLQRMMMALIRCDGKLHDCYCMEKEYGSSRLNETPQFCSAVLRISLPEMAEAEFEKISGMKLTKPPKIA